MSRFVVYAREGERCPWSHRVAWYDWSRATRVCWPIGLHLVARIARYFWVRSFVWFRRHDAWDEMCAHMVSVFQHQYRDAFDKKNEILELVLLAYIAEEREIRSDFDPTTSSYCQKIQAAIDAKGFGHEPGMTIHDD